MDDVHIVPGKFQKEDVLKMMELCRPKMPQTNQLIVYGTKGELESFNREFHKVFVESLEREKSLFNYTPHEGVLVKLVENPYYQSDIHNGTGSSSTFYQKVSTNVTGLIVGILFWLYRKSTRIRTRLQKIRNGVGSFFSKIF